MIDRFIDPASLFKKSDDGNRSMVVVFAVSAVGHLFFFLLLIFVPSQLPAKRYTPSVINVQMVSLPGNEFATRPGPPAGIVQPAQPEKAPPPVVDTSDIPKPVQVAPPKPQPKQVPEPISPPETISTAPVLPRETLPPDTISVAPKKAKQKVKTSLKKKTFKSAHVIKRAIKQIEKKAEVSRPNTVKEALDRMRSEVSKTEAQESAREETEKKPENSTTGGGGAGVGGGGSGIPGQPGVMGRRVLEKIDLYKLEIAYQIEKRWAFSEQLAGGRTDLEAVIVIKILSTGEIGDIWFEKKSGNSYFDESAVKAVKKSNPLPPLPKELGRSIYNVGLVFTPTGLRKG